MRSSVSFSNYRKGGQIMKKGVERNTKNDSERDAIYTYKEVVSNELVYSPLKM
jgi:hypothetical protein